MEPFDVVVVGGGLAGVVAALRLRCPEVVGAFPVSVALVHAGEPGGLLSWGGRRAFHLAGAPLKVGLEDWRRLWDEALAQGVVPVAGVAEAVLPTEEGFAVQTSAGWLAARAVVAASGAFAMANAGALRPRDGVVTAFGDLDQVRAVLQRAVARAPGRLALFGPAPILELAHELRALRPWVLVAPPFEGPLPPRTRVGTLLRVAGEPSVKGLVYRDPAGHTRTLSARTVYVDFNAPMAATRTSDYLAPTGVSRPRGFLAVDAHQATDVPGLFAAGDATGGVFSVAKALHEGNVAGLSALRHVHERAYGFTPGLYPFAWQPPGLSLSVFHRVPGVQLRLRDADPGVTLTVIGTGPTRALTLSVEQARVVRALSGRRGTFRVADLGLALAEAEVRAVLFTLVSLGALRVGHPPA